MTEATQPRPWRRFLILWTGPIAWIVQLCIGETLTGWPCFPATQRLMVPLSGYGWAGPVALGLLLICAALALSAGFLALRVRRDASDRQARTTERARFVGLWSAILGIGFGLASLVTLVAFAMVPQCLG